MKSPSSLGVCVCLCAFPPTEGHLCDELYSNPWPMKIAWKETSFCRSLSSLLLSLSSFNSGCSLLLHIPGHQLQTEVHLFSGKKNILDATRKFLVGVKPQSCLLWSCVRKLPEQSVCNSNVCNEGYNKFCVKSRKEIHVVTLTLEDINEVVFAWRLFWGLEDALWQHMN